MKKFFFSIDLRSIIISLMTIAPVVHLAFGDWFDTCFNTIAILCLIGLIKNKNLSDFQINWLYVAIFIAYPLEIFLSQLFRWQWRIHDYLDQSRFLLGLPIFLYLTTQKINYGKILEYILPIALITSFLTTKFIFFDNQYGDRFSNNFSDPLAYGQIALATSLMIFATFFINHDKNIKLDLLKIIGILFGIYISIKTQSRTGWASVVPVLFLLIWINKQKIKSIYGFLFIFLFILVLFGIYKFVPIVNTRVIQTLNEIITYPWHGGVAPETSVGQRITFYRIGWFYIINGHWYGWGERGFKDLLNSPELLSFSTKQTIEFCYIHLFHNEMLTQTVRYGLLGFLGYIVVFILPLINSLKLFAKFNTIKVITINTILVVTFIVTQMVAGISDEVINLKHMVMYFTLILAGLLSSINEYNRSQSYPAQRI